MEYAHVAALERDPERVWSFLWELDALLAEAEPNAAHTALARLETAGWLRSVITQNPDELHQRAGSRTVREIHGTAATLSCMRCRHRLGREEVDAEPPAPPPRWNRPPACRALPATPAPAGRPRRVRSPMRQLAGNGLATAA